MEGGGGGNISRYSSSPSVTVLPQLFQQRIVHFYAIIVKSAFFAIVTTPNQHQVYSVSASVCRIYTDYTDNNSKVTDLMKTIWGWRHPLALHLRSSIYKAAFQKNET